jgi:hypothetical protein
MADAGEPTTHLNIFKPNEYADLVNSTFLPTLVPELLDTLKSNLIASGAAPEKVLPQLTALSQELSTKDGIKAVLDRLGINNNTSEDYRIVTCESPAGTIVFKATQEKDGLVLTDTLTQKTDDIGETLLSSENGAKGFKKLPNPLVIKNEDMWKEATLAGDERTYLTPQAEKNMLPIIKLVQLADQASDLPAQGTNANLPHTKRPTTERVATRP